MSDDLIQALLKMRGPDKSGGSDLEVFSKQAADAWAEGRAKDLSDAVVQTIKSAGLNTEQVKRVIEFTNIEVYNREFKKESSSKVINFDGGPADPSYVLKEMNNGGGSMKVDHHSSDYDTPPSGEKNASASVSREFDQMFATSGGEYPEVNPMGGVMDLRDKLSCEHDNLVSQIGSLEVEFQDLSQHLFGQVKQAALSGHSLAEIVHIWNGVAPDQIFVKTAMEGMLSRLVENGVFTGEEMVASLQKFAEHRMPNPEHPLVENFIQYCDVLSKLAASREMREEVGNAVGDLNSFLKAAGLAGEVGGALRGAGSEVMHHAGNAGQAVGEFLGANPNSKLTRLAGQGAALAGVGVAGNEAYRRTLKYNPAWQKGTQLAKEITPGTQEYYNKEYQLMGGGGGFQ